MTMLRDNAGHVQLTDDQFNKLVELLTPGYECSKLMLAELQARAPQPDQPPTPPIEDNEPSDPNLPVEHKPWSEGDTLAAPTEEPAAETHETAEG